MPTHGGADLGDDLISEELIRAMTFPPGPAGRPSVRRSTLAAPQAVTGLPLAARPARSVPGRLQV